MQEAATLTSETNPEAEIRRAQIQEVLRATLVRPAKTAADITVMEHLSHVLQVALFMTEGLDLPEDEKNRVCLAAALHDLGKTVTAPTGKRWFHALESADLIEAALAEPHFAAALREIGLNPELDADELDRVKELVAEHHAIPAAALLHTPSAVIILAADGVASGLEMGWCGPIRTVIGGGYHESALALAEAMDLDPWADVSIRKLTLPSDTISDLLLAEKVFEAIKARLEELGFRTVMRESASLWIAGADEAMNALLDHEIAVADILDIDVLGEVYDRPGAPRVPAYSVESLEYLLLNDRVACSVLKAVFESAGEEKTRIMEKHGLTYDVLTAGHHADELTSPETLAEILYAGIRAHLVKLSPKSEADLAPSVAALLATSRAEAHKAQKRAIETAKKANKKIADEIEVIGKYITVWNAGRSILNALIARHEVRENVKNRTISFKLREVCELDGIKLNDDPPEILRSKQKYKAPCAACARHLATVQASTLLMGPTEGDGLWASAGARKKAKICAWCHMAGIADLPIVSVRKRGTRHVREANYLLVRSILSRDALIAVLEKLGLLTGTGIDLAKAEAAGKSEEFNADDEDFFNDLLGEVPEQTSVMRVSGMLGGLRSRGVSAIMLPGNTPLATKCIFALPSAAFFGFHRTGEMNQEVMDLISLGVVSVLKDELGPSTFTLRATSTKARVQIRSATLTDADLARGRAAWELAEMRRRLAFRIDGIQDPDALDIGFVLELRRDPRRAITSFIRMIRRSMPQNANGIARQVLSLAHDITAADADPVTPFLLETTRRLMRAGLIERGAGLVRATRGGGWARRSERGMTGPLLDLWKVADIKGVNAWLDGLVEKAPDAVGEIEAIRGELHDLVRSGIRIEKVLRRFNAEAPLLTLEAAQTK